MRTENITQSYPQTLVTKLFSSVPKREKAVDCISLSFGHQHECDDRFTILVGRSASGKSTLLRLLALLERPVSGNLFLNGNKYSYSFQSKEGTKAKASFVDKTHAIPKPVIIDSKPDCFDNRSSIIQRILDLTPEPHCIESLKVNNAEEMKKLKQNVVERFSDIVGLQKEQLYSSKPSNLTPSQQYLFGVVCACMESSFVNLSINTENVVEIPSPILLLDELLDRETSDVANKVGQALLNLTEMGSIVIAATHRPQYLTSTAKRTVTLSSGRVLTEQYH